MVADQVSPAKIKRYFVQWARWWVKTANTWDFQSLVEEFIRTCWQEAPALIIRNFNAILSKNKPGKYCIILELIVGEIFGFRE